jgi:hypothetical protein
MLTFLPFKNALFAVKIFFLLLQKLLAIHLKMITSLTPNKLPAPTNNNQSF